MDVSSHAAVTPQGVRDGDPAVLAALVARRGPAVLAFCEAVCEPDVAPQAVAETFARFRALVSTVDDAGGVDPEAFLIGATRHAAASMARVPTDGRGVLRALGRGTSPETYAAVPALLAARADSMLGGEDLERLSRLLERSPGCREVEASFRRAERGYRSPPDRELPPDTVGLVLSAMHGAAPVAAPFASAEPVAELPAVEEPPAAAPLVAAEPVAEPAAPQAPVPPAAAVAAPAEVVPEPEPEPATSIHAAVDPAARHEPPAEPEPEPAVEALPEAAAAVVDPPEDPALAYLEASGMPLEAPVGPRTRHRVRRGLPRVGLPRGSRSRGLHLPRRGSGAVDEDAVSVDHGPVYRLLLPAVAIVIAIVVMLVIAGVFGGGAPAPAVIRPAAATQIPPTSVRPAAAASTRTTGAVTLAPAPRRHHRSRTRRARKPSPATTVASARLTLPAASTPTAATTPPVAPATPAATVRPRKPRPAPAHRPTTTATADQVGSGSALPGAVSTAGSSGAVPVYQPGTTTTAP